MSQYNSDYPPKHRYYPRSHKAALVLVDYTPPDRGLDNAQFYILTGIENRFCYEENPRDPAYNESIRQFQSFPKAAGLSAAKNEARNRAYALSQHYRMNIHYTQIEEDKKEKDRYHTNFCFQTTDSTIGIIKGGVEQEDGGSWKRAVQRELAEETGIRITRTDRLQSINDDSWKSWFPHKAMQVHLFMMTVNRVEREWIERRILHREANHCGELFQLEFRNLDLIRSVYEGKALQPKRYPLQAADVASASITTHATPFRENDITAAVIDYLLETRREYVRQPPTEKNEMEASSPMAATTIDPTPVRQRGYRAALMVEPPKQGKYRTSGIGLLPVVPSVEETVVTVPVDDPMDFEPMEEDAMVPITTPLSIPIPESTVLSSLKSVVEQYEQSLREKEFIAQFYTMVRDGSISPDYMSQLLDHYTGQFKKDYSRHHAFSPEEWRAEIHPVLQQLQQTMTRYMMEQMNPRYMGTILGEDYPHKEAIQSWIQWCRMQFMDKKPSTPYRTILIHYVLYVLEQDLPFFSFMERFVYSLEVKTVEESMFGGKRMKKKQDRKLHHSKKKNRTNKLHHSKKKSDNNNYSYKK
jgi:hypothetical protein